MAKKILKQSIQLGIHFWYMVASVLEFTVVSQGNSKVGKSELITDHIHSTSEGDVFTSVSHSVHRGHASQVGT